MSEPGPSSGDASSNNSENEIRILKRKLAAAEDDKKQLEFQMAEKKSKSTFQDYLLEGETLHVSARRRLKFQNKKVTYKVNATIKNIVAKRTESLTAAVLSGRSSLPARGNCMTKLCLYIMYTLLY